MRACDKVSGTHLARRFIDLVTLMLLLFAAVDDVVSEEEAGFVNTCADTLSASLRPGRPQGGEGAPGREGLRYPAACASQGGRPRRGRRSGRGAGQAAAAAGEGGGARPQPGGADGRAGRPVRSGQGEGRRKEPHQSGEGAQAAPGARPARTSHESPPGLSGQSGHRKNDGAPLLAKIYRAIGVLSKGQLVEVDRSGLVAGFVGQTALKTGEVIEKALGGVLFIDEAYALANQDAPNDFGREAIETLLKGMEDHRDDLIVIAAGYTELMGRFLHANPGLESRFNKYFYFEDYNGAQLLAIFQSMCAKNGYTLDDKATEYAESYFKTLYEERDENFGNARDMRNVFERAVARQSDRVAALEKPGKEELMALTVADLQEEGGPVPDGAPDGTPPESP